MSNFQFESRVGFNEVEQRFEVQLLVKNIITRDEAISLGQAFGQQFQDFIKSRGGTISAVTSPMGSEIKPGLFLPPGLRN